MVGSIAIDYGTNHSNQLLNGLQMDSVFERSIFEPPLYVSVAQMFVIQILIVSAKSSNPEDELFCTCDAIILYPRMNYLVPAMQLFCTCNAIILYLQKVQILTMNYLVPAMQLDVRCSRTS